MQSSQDESACGNPSCETSLLSQTQLSRWEGSPLGWIEATPHTVHTDMVVERNVLVMIDQGATQADFRYGNKAHSWEFTTGSIGFFAEGTELKLSRWRWAPARRIFIGLDASISADVAALETLRTPPRQTEFEFRDPQLASLLRGMVLEIATGSKNGTLFAESLSLGVAMRLHQRAAPGLRSGRERGKLTMAQSSRIHDLVSATLPANIPLSKLAAAVGYSPAQFVRLFKNTFGLTPHQYVLRMRLERAKEMVVEGRLPLMAIAVETGFSSQSHMTAAFVRAFGSTPGDMRRLPGMHGDSGK